MRNLGENVGLEISIATVENVLERPRKVLQVNIFSNQNKSRVDVFDNFVKRHRVPITKNVAAGFNSNAALRFVRTSMDVSTGVFVRHSITRVGRRFGEKGVQFHLVREKLLRSWGFANDASQTENRMHEVGLEVLFHRENGSFPSRSEVEEVVGVLHIRRIVRGDL